MSNLIVEWGHEFCDLSEGTLCQSFLFINRMAISNRAQRAAGHSRVSGIPMEILYQGGMEVRSKDMLPFFQTGKPPEIQHVYYQVGDVDEEGGLRLCEGRYIPQNDVWVFANGARKRSGKDLWLTNQEYQIAFKQAAKNVKARLQTA